MPIGHHLPTLSDDTAPMRRVVARPLPPAISVQASALRGELDRMTKTLHEVIEACDGLAVRVLSLRLALAEDARP